MWLEHLGLKPSDAEQVRDPTCNATYNGRWLATAIQNQSRFTNIFPYTPCDSLRSIQVRAPSLFTGLHRAAC